MKKSVYLCPVGLKAEHLIHVEAVANEFVKLKLRRFSLPSNEIAELFLNGKRELIIEKSVGAFLTQFGKDQTNLVTTGFTRTINPVVDIDLQIDIAKNLSLNPLFIINGEGRSELELKGLFTYIKEKASGLLGVLVYGNNLSINDALYLGTTTSDYASKLPLLLEKAETLGTTFKMFESSLIEQVKGQKRRHIVLPEGNDERVLKAADLLIKKDILDISILGDANQIAADAKKLGLDLSKAKIFDPMTSEKTKIYATELYNLRKSKGVSEADALTLCQDVTYFGTMMLKMNDADGMVSGACHATSDTVRPALQIIKTVPESSIVSSIFFMCLHNRVVIYGDCAICPNPTAEQLAEVAITSADTAKSFGMEPRVAFLSYSTGTSGAGPDVDFVKQAVSIAKERRPDLMMDGPIQYDAAVDYQTGSKKMPGSKVAGLANVLIFPELNSGNIGYKIAQREGHAEAIGPMLQGLNKPMNDLSRGCFVQDIVNTVYLTAIQVK